MLCRRDPRGLDAFHDVQGPERGGGRAVRRLPVAGVRGARRSRRSAAFFVTQHLKVTTPLIAGFPAPVPACDQSGDGSGRAAASTTAAMSVSFYLLHRADDVDVYVVDQSGHDRRARSPRAATCAAACATRTGVFSLERARGQRPGRARRRPTTSASRCSPGPHGRDLEPAGPRRSPSRRSRRARWSRRLAVADPAAATPGHDPLHAATSTAAATCCSTAPTCPARRGWSRASATARQRASAAWDGLIDGRPAPAGHLPRRPERHRRGLQHGPLPGRDAARARARRRTPGVTVRYLAAAAAARLRSRPGRARLVYVDARQHAVPLGAAPGRRREAGRARARGTPRLRAARAAAAGARRGPVRAGAALGRAPHGRCRGRAARRGAARRSVLVVLPALTWQGQNPVDDDGDGMPTRSTTGGPIELDRPFVNGLPAGFGDEAGLLAYLDQAHLPLRPDDRPRPDRRRRARRSAGTRGVVLAGSERWLPRRSRAGAARLRRRTAGTCCRSGSTRCARR